MLAELNAEISAAFDDPDGLADAVRGFAGRRTGAGAYDPATGATTGATLLYTGRGVFANFSAQDADGSLILSTDQKLIALQSEVTARPQVGDTINGKRLLSVGEDPVRATYVLQLRA